MPVCLCGGDAPDSLVLWNHNCGPLSPCAHSLGPASGFPAEPSVNTLLRRSRNIGVPSTLAAIDSEPRCGRVREWSQPSVAVASQRPGLTRREPFAQGCSLTFCVVPDRVSGVLAVWSEFARSCVATRTDLAVGLPLVVPIRSRSLTSRPQEFVAAASQVAHRQPSQRKTLGPMAGQRGRPRKQFQFALRRWCSAQASCARARAPQTPASSPSSGGTRYCSSPASVSGGAWM